MNKYKMWLSGLSMLLIVLLMLLGAIMAVRRLNKRPMTSLYVRLSKYRKLAPYLEAQARHETNNYRSEVYRRANNLFGMKDAYKRPRLGVDVAGDPYRHYKSDSESIRDMLLWLSYNKAPVSFPDSNSYAVFLKNKGYFEDSLKNYQKGMLVWY